MAAQEPGGDLTEIPAELPEVLDARDKLRRHAAKLYGLGLQRREIARVLVDYLAKGSEDRPLEQRLMRARTKLKRWEHQDSFRDLVYEQAKIQLDMETPGILKGIAKQAKRGKVDAAKLALELTGRYSPKGEQQPTQVAVVIGAIPRPATTNQQILEFQPDDD